jgi:hypothetical protein
LILFNHNMYKYFQFVDFAAEDDVQYMDRNMQQCYKKQILLTDIVHLLDKCSKIHLEM